MKRPWVGISAWLLSWSLVVAHRWSYDASGGLNLDLSSGKGLSLEDVDFTQHVTRHAYHPAEHELAERQDLNITFNPPPSQDSWYSPPDGWETLPSGTVLRLRPNAFTPFAINNSMYAYQVLYTSLDTHGNASWAVSTTWIPMSAFNCTAFNQTSACAHGIVTYQLPYDTADLDASPSYLLQFGEPYGEMADLLNRGWFVLVPDYEGPNASYCAGPQAAYATLDAAKTALEVAPLFGLLGSESKIAVWGYSGGAFAAAFTAEMAATHIPDTKISGITFGGSAPNLTTVTQLMNAKDTAGLFVASLVGITSQQEGARKYMLDHMHETGPYNTTTFMNATTMSGVNVLSAYAYQNVYDYFANGSADLAAPAILDVFDSDGMLGYHGTPNMPVFVYKADQDEMSPIAETDALVEKYCAAGANVLYHRNSMGTHNIELWTGRLRVMEFLHTVLDGDHYLAPPATGCVTVNVTIDILFVLPNIFHGVLTLGPMSENNGV